MPYSSRPEAVPTAATAQKVAAVDRPRTVVPRRRMTPAPRKPTPVAIAPSAAPGLLPPCATAMRAKTQAAAETRAQERRPAGMPAPLPLRPDGGAEQEGEEDRRGGMAAENRADRLSIAGPPPASDVEAEQQDVAVLDDVFLALDPHLAGFLGALLAAQRDEVVIGDASRRR